MKNAIPFILILFIASCSQKNRISSTPSEKDKKHAKLIKDTLAEEQNIHLVLDSSYFEYGALNKILTDEKSNTSEIRSEINELYVKNEYQPKWMSPKGPTNTYYAFTNLLDHCDRFALRPQDYTYRNINLEILHAYSSDNKEELLKKLEIKISALYFLFTEHMISGRINNPGNGERLWIRNNTKDQEKCVQALLNSKNGNQLVKNVEALNPPFEQFSKLQEVLYKYIELDKKYGNELFDIQHVDKIEAGDLNAEIPKIRRRLAATDSKLNATSVDSLVYQKDLQEAVRRFQDRHGLLEDGVIGPNTINYLNISFSEKIECIKLNMERYRWQHRKEYDHYLTVNIPEFKLRIYEQNKQKLEMRVVVGKTFTSTPVFTDTLQYIVFSPTWIIPRSIIVNEMIPKLRNNPNYYSDRDYIFYKNQEEFDPSTEKWNNPMLNLDDYMVIQEPGPENALGLVKFIMPNHMSIYLHDTPSDHLFNRTERAFSHGCIRVEEPSVLAKYLLKENDGWNNKKVVESMFLEEPKRVNLAKPYPVMISYYTAWVDNDGNVNFREDIYGHDRKQLAMLNGY